MKETAIHSQKTKKKLSKALKKLMKEKSFYKITINDIAISSKVNRNTFYYHFEDINSLFKWTLEQETFNLLKEIDLSSDFQKGLEFIIDYVQNNKFLLKSLTTSFTLEEVKNFFYSDLIELVTRLVSTYEKELNVALDKDFKSFVCHFYTEAIASNLLSYLNDNKNLSKKDLTLYTSVMLKNGIKFLIKEYASDISTNNCNEA